MPEMPTDERIAALKAQFPDRVLKLVEAVDKKEGSEEVVLNLVMTGPARHEYNFFVEKMLKAGEVKDAGDRIKATRQVIEDAVHIQIRWPEWDVVKKEFDARPQMVDGLAKTLERLSGGQVEFREKNL